MDFRGVLLGGLLIILRLDKLNHYGFRGIINS